MKKIMIFYAFACVQMIVCSEKTNATLPDEPSVKAEKIRPEEKFKHLQEFTVMQTVEAIIERLTQSDTYSFDGSKWRTEQGILLLLDSKYNFGLATPFGRVGLYLPAVDNQRGSTKLADLFPAVPVATDMDKRFFRLVASIFDVRYLGNLSCNDLTDEKLESDGKKVRELRPIDRPRSYDKCAVFKLCALKTLPTPTMEKKETTPASFVSAIEPYRHKFGKKVTLPLRMNIERAHGYLIGNTYQLISSRYDCLWDDA